MLPGEVVTVGYHSRGVVGGSLFWWQLVAAMTVILVLVRGLVVSTLPVSQEVCPQPARSAERTGALRAKYRPMHEVGQR